VVFFADTLDNSLGSVHLFLQLDPCIIGDVIAITEPTKLQEHKYKNKHRSAQIFELEPI
jgi:hypothetical protein